MKHSTMFNEFKLTSVYKGNKPAAFMSVNRNNHTVYVTNTNTGNRASFEYWESLNKQIISSDNQLLMAFQCFLSDATAGDLSRFDFISEFGYDCKTGKKIHIECEKQLKKALNVCLDLNNVYDTLNELYNLEM